MGKPRIPARGLHPGYLLIPEVCRQLGIRIGAIRRIRVGRIAIGDLGEGQWRYLGENERF